MADFCEWVVAAEPAFGWEPGRFLDTYAGNRESAHAAAIESSPIAAGIRTLAEVGFEGTASELLTLLNEETDDEIKRLKMWPKSPSALSGALRRLAPNLREIGVEIEWDREGSSRKRTIIVKKIEAGKERPQRPRRPPGTESADGDADGDGDVASAIHAQADGADGEDGDLRTQSNGAAPTGSESLADALRDPDQAEALRASVGGEWVDPQEPLAEGTLVLDYTRTERQLGLAAYDDEAGS